jgi:hypothetical protein
MVVVLDESRPIVLTEYQSPYWSIFWAGLTLDNEPKLFRGRFSLNAQPHTIILFFLLPQLHCSIFSNTISTSLSSLRETSKYDTCIKMGRAMNTQSYLLSHVDDTSQFSFLFLIEHFIQFLRVLGRFVVLLPKRWAQKCPTAFASFSPILPRSLFLSKNT